MGDLILRPHPKVTLSSEFHSLKLTNANDLWYAGGGVFQPWTFGYIGRSTSGRRSLGNLYDTSAEYRANRNVTVTAYLGYTQGWPPWKRFIRKTRTAGLDMWNCSTVFSDAQYSDSGRTTRFCRCHSTDCAF